MPIVTANMHGPARSPTVLESPNAASAYADAHCDMESSDAAEQIIKQTASQNRGFLARDFIPMLSVSSTRGSIGQVAKLYILIAGISAHNTDSNFQFAIPNMEKNKVESKIVPTKPQQ